MRKKYTYRFWAMTLVFVMIISALLPVNQVYATNANAVRGENEAVQYIIYKNLYEDKTAIALSLNLQEKEGIQVKKVSLPDGKEQIFDGSSIQFETSKNGEYQFQVSYEKNNPLSFDTTKESQTFVADITVNVTELAQEDTDVEKQIIPDKVETKTIVENLRKLLSSKEVSDVVSLKNSILSAEDGVETTLLINSKINVDEEITIPADKIIRFVGNGSLVRTTTLIKSAHMILIEEGGHLVLDGVTLDGDNVGSKHSVANRVASAMEILGEFTMVSGTITQHTCYVLHVSGPNARFNMTGGSINNNIAASGVFLENHANFVMDGGDISNNKFDSSSGMEQNSVFLRNGSKFILNDGMITNNEHRDILSTAVFVEGGRSGKNYDPSSFIMNGGEISYNFSSHIGGGVTVGTWGNPDYKTVATFEMNGGTISNNTSTYGGGGVLIDRKSVV